MKTSTVITAILLFIAVSAHSQLISRGQTIVGAEYFMGTDPGAGNGLAIPATYGSAAVNASFIPQIPKGTILYVRFRSSDGIWSSPYPVTGRSSSSGATLSNGEYFINEDPGVGNGTSFPVSSIGQILISSPPLSRGDTLCLRVEDSFGRWSPPRAIEYNFRTIVGTQFYIKYANGAMASTNEMSLADSLPNYPVFVATSPNITALASGDTVYVRVQDENSFWSPWASSPGAVTAIREESDSTPKEFRLYQAYPNPFNPSTTIQYELPVKSHVSIILYDVLGRSVSHLVNDIKPPGKYTINFEASGISSGVYFYRIDATSVGTTIPTTFFDTRKVMLLK